MERGEYYLLVLFATLGMQVMISANHLLTLYLGLELLSLAIYALVALTAIRRRRPKRR
jgi:NADH-quinone oxidoreductase subunit N